MRSLRPAPRKGVLTPAEWEFLEYLNAMKESRHHPDYEGESDRAYLRQQQNKCCPI